MKETRAWLSQKMAFTERDLAVVASNSEPYD